MDQCLLFPILPLDVKSLLIWAPSTHRMSSSASPRLGHTCWLKQGAWWWRHYGNQALLSFLHPLTCGQSTGEWWPLAHWVPPGSTVLLWALCSGCPSSSLLTYFWFHVTCTIFVFSLVTSPCPSQLPFSFSCSLILSLPGRALWSDNSRRVCLSRICHHDCFLWTFQSLQTHPRWVLNPASS